MAIKEPAKKKDCAPPKARVSGLNKPKKTSLGG
jgi:hypothetical protein